MTFTTVGLASTCVPTRRTRIAPRFIANERSHFMKLFIDVVFALLPLALIALPITVLLILHGVLVKRERK